MISLDEKSLSKLEEVIKYELIKLFNDDVVDEIKNLIISSYEQELEGIVDSEYDNIKPESYKDSFIKRLNEFGYIVDDDGGENVTFICPDMDNFDFSDGLEFIYNILSGLVGNYYKVHSSYLGYEDEDTMFIVGESNPYIEYLDLNKLELFEFSNTEPKDIFQDAEEFVSDNMEEWLGQASEFATQKFKDYFSGVNIYG